MTNIHHICDFNLGTIEFEVFSRLIEGETHAEIARRLGYSEITISIIKQSAIQKIGGKNFVDSVRIFLLRSSDK